jgi:hypothetical protein
VVAKIPEIPPPCTDRPVYFPYALLNAKSVLPGIRLLKFLKPAGYGSGPGAIPILSPVYPVKSIETTAASADVPSPIEPTPVAR